MSPQSGRPPRTGTDGTSRRLLLVHAHPDDETLTTGATMARYAREGAAVTLVTCTLGEEGEVIGSEHAALVSSRRDQLGPHRLGELDRAAAALGVRDHRLLADGRWRDSGMAWLAPGMAGAVADAHPRAFARASVDEAGAELARVVREVRPQVVVTYDARGGYGHPDHVQAHRVTHRALELARDPGAGPDGVAVAGWSVSRLFWVQVRESWARAERDQVLAAAAAGRLPPGLVAPDPGAVFPPAVLPDAQVPWVVGAPEDLAAKVAALRAHATQVRVDEPWFALSNDVAQVLSASEGFRRAGSTASEGIGGIDGIGFTDLFAGLDEPGG